VDLSAIWAGARQKYVDESALSCYVVSMFKVY
jgi:hypothetical protein